ncbi:MAG TPA: SMC-Scp complex subunit ScpB [Polyangia bacterium]|nr:SMC-Scp complex subunit ScpB [Polyangia bacterium]
MKKRKSPPASSDKAIASSEPEAPNDPAIEDGETTIDEAIDATPASQSPGEDVTTVGEDVTSVAEEVTLVGQDVSTLGEDVTASGDDARGEGDEGKEDGEDAWDDEAVTVVAGVQTLGEDVTVPGEYAAAWDDAAPPASADGEAVPEGEGEVAASEGEGETEETEALPDDDSRFESILESLLFATDRPLSVADLKRLLGERDSKRVSAALESLRERRAESGVQLISVAGAWQLRTHPANGAWVAKLVSGRPQRLSRAMMETLAIVAYRQPITRPEIDEIRGVDCGPVLRTLLDRTLIRVIGKREEVGRPLLYGTTPEFLKTFSLRDLTELPTLREFHELGAEEQARVDATAPAPDGGAPVSPGDAPLRPSTVELPEVDTAEEDALLDELEQATQLASRATKAPIDPEAEAAADAAGPDAGEP